MSQPVRFGLFLGQADRSWSEILEAFQEADELGFDHAWLVDHLLPTDGPVDGAQHEAWTLLAGLAASTKRIGLGVLVSSNTFRHPALLAKEAVTVDHISGGRLILGIGTGWHEDEHRRYGVGFPSAAERVDRLEEAVKIIDSLMRQERTTFQGRHYRLADAPLEPKPIQRPRIPLLIGAHRPRMLRIAARYADIWDTFPEITGAATEGVTEDLATRAARLEEACRTIDRDPAEIRRSTWVSGSVARSLDGYRYFVERHRALGFTDLLTGHPGARSERVLRRIAEELLPELRNA